MARKSYDNLETDYFDEEVGGSFLSLMSLVVAFLAVAAFIGLAWYAYQDSDDELAPGEVETIYAEEGEIRMEPEGESGWQFPDSDRQVYNLGNGDVDDMKVEQILPKPERPKPLESAAVETEGWINNGDSELAQESSEVGLTDAERRKMEEIANASVQKAPEVVVQAAEVEMVKPVVEPVKKMVPAPAPAPVVKKAKPKPAPAPKKATLTRNRLQLGAFGSRSEALKNWSKIKSGAGSLLGSKKAHIEKADVKGKTYYRVHAYPFSSKSQADALCVMLKSKNQPCFSVKR